MATIDPVAHPLRPAGAATRAGLILPVFALALFLSATLLFALQPMFTKMVLPLLGGSPSVWSVAMVFFQTVLLLGYAYAHLLTRYVPPRVAVVAHAALLAVAFVSLPVGIADHFAKPPSEGAALWLLALFAASIGLPFFAVAANAPMLQAWFARTGHVQAGDPYFLYGASNLGSFVVLIAYPLLIEPALTLREQAGLWSAGFGMLLALIAIAGALLVAATRLRPTPITRQDAAAEHAPSWPDRMRWTALAFVPSGLLVAVTSHLSTDIASAPFLWVVPLALFLATFVLTFRPGGARTTSVMLVLQPLVVATLAIGPIAVDRTSWALGILLDLGMLLTTAMICHREIYRRRPAAGHLTEFYMWISVGGVLGGAFCGLLAPAIFPDIWEYPILIVLALACRPATWQVDRRTWLTEGGLAVAAILVAVLPHALFRASLPVEAKVWCQIILVALVAAIMLQTRRPVRMIGLTALALVLTSLYQPGLNRTETARSFFGVHKVVESADGQFRMLLHGTTVHGAQRLREEGGTPEPLTYYYFGGPLSEVIAAAREARGALRRVAVVGLGVGSLACHAHAGEQWRYYEIDPQVVRIARDATKFRFLSSCAPQTEIVLGDARLTLADAPAGFDLIILDAFSSDVIPVHLLTREAVGLYLGKLAEGGVLAFHISNRYLELASVTTEVAAMHGLVTYVKMDTAADPERFRQNMYTVSQVAVVARRDSDLGTLRARDGWQRRDADGSVRAWTDDYSDILSAVRRMLKTKL
jgi:spermidine synthase